MSENEKRAVMEVFRDLEEGYKQGDVDRCLSNFHRENVSLNSY